MFIQSDHEVDSFAPAFHLDPPPHAFPSPWPPACPYDPFPMGDDRPTFEVHWLRITLPHPVVRPSAPDMSDLVLGFSKLSIVEEQIATAHTDKPVASGSHAGSSPHIGFTIPCLRAPHPALIRHRRGSLQCLHGFDEQPHVRSPRDAVPRGRRHASRQPPGTSLPFSTLCRPPPSSPCATSSPKHQPKHGLPRRLPKHLPLLRPPHVDTNMDSQMMSTIARTPSLQSASSSDLDSPLPSPFFSATDSLPLVAEAHYLKTEIPLCLPVIAVEDLRPPLSGVTVANESWSDLHFPVQETCSLFLS